MLDEFNPALPKLEFSRSLSEAVVRMPEKALQSAILQLARRLRGAGHAESAHFLDVAALILKEQ